jgi:hypothetical protein
MFLTQGSDSCSCFYPGWRWSNLPEVQRPNPGIPDRPTIFPSLAAAGRPADEGRPTLNKPLHRLKSSEGQITLWLTDTILLSMRVIELA